MNTFISRLPDWVVWLGVALVALFGVIATTNGRPEGGIAIGLIYMIAGVITNRHDLRHSKIFWIGVLLLILGIVFPLMFTFHGTASGNDGPGITVLQTYKPFPTGSNR